jgi:hypothetical protein
MTKQFKDYLAESTRKYDFRIKIAGDVSADKEALIKALLGKFQVTEFKKSGTTPIQELPLDFPKIKNATVNIYEVTLDYPATQWELSEYLCANANIVPESIVVRRPHEALEEYQEPQEARTEALLTDGEYKESPNATFDDFYGDKYNTGFVKELNDILKLQRKERGEEIPEAKSDEVLKNPGDTLVKIPQNNKAVLTQAEDPRK